MLLLYRALQVLQHHDGEQGQRAVQAHLEELVRLRLLCARGIMCKFLSASPFCSLCSTQRALSDKTAASKFVHALDHLQSLCALLFGFRSAACIPAQPAISFATRQAALDQPTLTKTVHCPHARWPSGALLTARAERTLCTLGALWGSTRC